MSDEHRAKWDAYLEHVRKPPTPERLDEIEAECQFSSDGFRAFEIPPLLAAIRSLWAENRSLHEQLSDANHELAEVERLRQHSHQPHNTADHATAVAWCEYGTDVSVPWTPADAGGPMKQDLKTGG